MWNGVEDHCLNSFADFCMQQTPLHLSLHFDGVRLDRESMITSGKRMKTWDGESEWPIADFPEFLLEAQRHASQVEASRLEVAPVIALAERIPRHIRKAYNLPIDVSAEVVHTANCEEIVRGINEMVKSVSEGRLGPVTDDEAGEEFIRQAMAHVKRKTGYSMNIKIKKHHYLTEMLSTIHNHVVTAGVVQESLIQDGNCIPLALSRLQECAAEGASQLLVVRDSQTADGGERTVASKSYRQSMELFGVGLTPSLAIDMRKLDSRWLVHCEKGGVPHCIAVHVVDARECTVEHGNQF